MVFAVLGVLGVFQPAIDPRDRGYRNYYSIMNYIAIEMFDIQEVEFGRVIDN